MKTLCLTAAIAFTVATTASAQPGESAQPAAPTCVQTYNIDHTKAPDDKSILFYMRDGTILRSQLRNACPTLSINGFSYVSNPAPQLCAGLQTIRVLRTGAVCMMGPFMRYTPPPRPAN
jgi:hypothetical protein